MKADGASTVASVPDSDLTQNTYSVTKYPFCKLLGYGTLALAPAVQVKND